MKIFKYIKKYENLVEQLEQQTNSVSIDGEQDFMLPNIAPSTTPPPPDPDPQTEPQTDPLTDPGTDPETDPQTDPDTLPQTDPDPLPQTDPQTNPDTIPPTLPIPSIIPSDYTFVASASTNTSETFTVNLNSIIEGDSVRWEIKTPDIDTRIDVTAATDIDPYLDFERISDGPYSLKITKKEQLTGISDRNYTLTAIVGNHSNGERSGLANINVEAAQESVTVSFHIYPPEGGSPPEGSPLTKTVAYGQSLTQLLINEANTWARAWYNTSNKHYRFDGWAKSHGTAIDENELLTEDTDYSAKWVRQFKVLFYKYGTTNDIPDISATTEKLSTDIYVDTGGKLLLSKCPDTNIFTNYTFDMWSETIYGPKNTPTKFNFNTTITLDIELYAWVYSKITLLALYPQGGATYGQSIGGYTDNGISTAQCILQVYPSRLKLLTTPTTIASGWYLKGWAETDNWEDGDDLILPNTNYTPTGNKKLYAVYAELNSSLTTYRLGDGTLTIYAGLKLPDIIGQTDPAIVEYDETSNSFKLHTIKLFDEDNNITNVSDSSLNDVNDSVDVSEASLFSFIRCCRQFEWLLNGGPNIFGNTTYLLDKSYNILYIELDTYAKRNHIDSIPGNTKITNIKYSAGSSATITVTYKCGYCGKTANIISGIIDSTGIVKWNGTTLGYGTGLNRGKKKGDYAELINQLIDNQPKVNNMPTMEGININTSDGIDLTFVNAIQGDSSSYYTIKVSLTANLSNYEFSRDGKPTIFNYMVEKNPETPGSTQNYVDSWWPDYILNDKLYLKPGINIIKFSKSAHVAFEVDSEALESQRLLIGQLDIVKVLQDENDNSDLGLNIDTLDYRYPHVLTENITVLDRSVLLLKDINLADTSHEFYYNMPIDNSTGIELSETSLVDNSRKEILTDPRAWYSMNNVNSKFVISEIDADYLSDGIKVAKSSKL